MYINVYHTYIHTCIHTYICTNTSHTLKQKRRMGERGTAMTLQRKAQILKKVILQ
jgi:hypothetical protein